MEDANSDVTRELQDVKTYVGVLRADVNSMDRNLRLHVGDVNELHFTDGKPSINGDDATHFTSPWPQRHVRRPTVVEVVKALHDEAGFDPCWAEEIDIGRDVEITAKREFTQELTRLAMYYSRGRKCLGKDIVVRTNVRITYD
jgi:hypothetical protein